MVSGNEPTFIDFQDAQIGPKDYDMASLLYDTYHPMSESDRKKHVGFYFDQNVKN
jgi:aminoglycoside/choline kinase family phosphotransferase